MFERISLLLSRGRFTDAELELRRHLSQQPGDPGGHALLALTLAELDRKDEALEEAEQAIGLAPDFPFGHYVRAMVLYEQERYEVAEEAIAEALRLSPEDPDAFALQATIAYSQRRWADALAAAEAGLAIEAEHVRCNNLRAMALVQLGRRDEAGATIDAALARNPDNAVTHANMGWKLLHDNQPRPALDHFREALRLEPGLEWARRGIIEALKARNPLYRMMLRYFLWMSRLSGKMQWGFIIGAYVLFRVLGEVAERNPGWGGVLWPVIGLYFVFVLLSWVASPLFDLLLRLDPFGRYALSADERMAANWIGVCLLTAFLLLGGGLATGLVPLYLGAAAAAAMMVPVSGVYSRPSGKRRMLGFYTLGLIAAAVSALALALAEPANPLAGTLTTVFIFGWVAFSWIGNAVNS